MKIKLLLPESNETHRRGLTWRSQVSLTCGQRGSGFEPTFFEARSSGHLDIRFCRLAP